MFSQARSALLPTPFPHCKLPPPRRSSRPNPQGRRTTKNALGERVLGLLAARSHGDAVLHIESVGAMIVGPELSGDFELIRGGIESYGCGKLVYRRLWPRVCPRSWGSGRWFGGWNGGWTDRWFWDYCSVVVAVGSGMDVTSGAATSGNRCVFENSIRVGFYTLREELVSSSCLPCD